MKWRREIDYHGSRRYGSEDAPVRLPALTLAWLVEMARIKLGKLRAQPRSAELQLKDRNRNFSLPGSNSAVPADCPFPVKPQISERDWRVFP